MENGERLSLEQIRAFLEASEEVHFEGKRRQEVCDWITGLLRHCEPAGCESRDVNGARAAQGDVRVNTQVVGFKKVRFYTLENVGAGNLSMPEREMQTTAFWLRFPESFLARFQDLTPTEKQNGLTGLANVLRTVGALLLMCDPHDLGIAFAEDISKGARSFEPDLFLFDNYPGGIGQSQPLFKLTSKLQPGAMDVLRSCSCDAGCPAGVGPVGEVGERGKRRRSGS